MTNNLNPETLSKFIAWLDLQLKARGWSDSQLAKKAGITHPVISKARSGIQAIGWDACVNIARALELPPETVLRKAGLLPERPEESQLNNEILFLVDKLPIDDQEEILAIARMKLEKQKNTAPSTRRTGDNIAPATS